MSEVYIRNIIFTEGSEAQAEVLSYIIDIESIPKRQNRRRKTHPKPISRKYIVKNRSRNYGVLARMSTNEEESEAVPTYSWTSVEETQDRKSVQQPLVFEPFSTDPKKHAAVFAWIDQMINGYSDSVPSTKRKPTQSAQVRKDQKKLRSAAKKSRTMTVRKRPRRPGTTSTPRLVNLNTPSTTSPILSLTTSPTIGIARTTSSARPLKKASKAKGHYRYSVDNGPFGAKEEFDGIETQGQYNINRSGFFHKTIYSVTSDSGFQSDSSYSIFS